MTDNRHTINLTKTKAMLSGSKYTINRIGALDLAINGFPTELVKEYRYNGIIRDSTIISTNHVYHLRNKLIGRLKMLGKQSACGRVESRDGECILYIRDG